MSKRKAHKAELYIDSVYGLHELYNAFQRLDRLTTAELTHELIRTPTAYPCTLVFELQTSKPLPEVLAEAKKALGPLNVRRKVWAVKVDDDSSGGAC
jgi:hypothetical protein